jgi:hypothetical protein
MLSPVILAAAPQITVNTPNGTVTLTDPELQFGSFGAQFSTTVNNRLDSSWVEFTIKADGVADCGPRGPVPVSFTAKLGPVWAKENNRRTVQVELDRKISECALIVKSATLVPAMRSPEEMMRIFREQSLLPEGLAVAARLAYMKTLPVLSSGLKQAFVAADKKCSAQFQEALPGEGVDAKKKLTEIISLCGYLVDSGSRIESYRMEGDYGFVSIFESDIKGWVPRKWIWIPDPK